jgi:hypothetical protein
MPEVDNSAAGVVPAAEKPTVTADSQQPVNGQQSQAPADGGGMSLEHALAELEKVRKALKETNAESAGRRKRLDELEAAERTRQDAALTDAQKTEKRMAELQAKLDEREREYTAASKAHQERVIRYEVMLKASNLGVVDPDAAVKLMDWAALEFDEDGTPKNVDAVLKQLLKARPYLLKQPQAPAPNINAQATGNQQGTEAARAEELKRRFRLG